MGVISGSPTWESGVMGGSPTWESGAPPPPRLSPPRAPARDIWTEKDSRESRKTVIHQLRGYKEFGMKGKVEE